MATIFDLENRLRNYNPITVGGRAIEATSQGLLDRNREQMLEGKRSDGNDITPSYFQDPYFKSAESAKRYSAWKDSITPHPLRKPGTPNLFITGVFHFSIKLRADGSNIIYESDFDGANDIERKFTSMIYGLGKEKKIDYIEKELQKQFITETKRELKL